MPFDLWSLLPYHPLHLFLFICFLSPSRTSGITFWNTENIRNTRYFRSLAILLSSQQGAFGGWLVVSWLLHHSMWSLHYEVFENLRKLSVSEMMLTDTPKTASITHLRCSATYTNRKCTSWPRLLADFIQLHSHGLQEQGCLLYWVYIQHSSCCI